MRTTNWMEQRVQAVQQRLAQRRADRPERLRRRAEAKAYRLEMKRRHETGSWGGGGGA